MLSILSPWGAAAGAAIGSAVASAAEKLGDSFSFADLLHSKETEESGDALPLGDAELATLREQSQARLSALEAKLTQLLQSAGVALHSPLELEVESFGDIRVASGHAQSSQIELLLNEDPSLRQELTELQATQAEVERLELALRAERMEPLDPRAAAALRQQARHYRGQPPRLVLGRSVT